MLDLTRFKELLANGVAVGLSRLGQGPHDVLIWQVATDNIFSSYC